jgi:hypothetical protein
MMNEQEEFPTNNALNSNPPNNGIMEAPPQKRGYGLLGAEAKKFMNDKDQI